MIIIWAIFGYQFWRSYHFKRFDTPQSRLLWLTTFLIFASITISENWYEPINTSFKIPLLTQYVKSSLVIFAAHLSYCMIAYGKVYAKNAIKWSSGIMFLGATCVFSLNITIGLSDVETDIVIYALRDVSIIIVAASSIPQYMTNYRHETNPVNKHRLRFYFLLMLLIFIRFIPTYPLALQYFYSQDHELFLMRVSRFDVLPLITITIGILILPNRFFIPLTYPRQVFVYTKLHYLEKHIKQKCFIIGESNFVKGLRNLELGTYELFISIVDLQYKLQIIDKTLSNDITMAIETNNDYFDAIASLAQVNYHAR